MNIEDIVVSREGRPDAISHGNIVLFVGVVGDISGCKDTFLGSCRSLLIHQNFSELVGIHQVPDESRVGNRADGDEYPAYGQVLFTAVLFV